MKLKLARLSRTNFIPCKFKALFFMIFWFWYGAPFPFDWCHILWLKVRHLKHASESEIFLSDHLHKFCDNSLGESEETYLSGLIKTLLLPSSTFKVFDNESFEVTRNKIWSKKWKTYDFTHKQKTSVLPSKIIHNFQYIAVHRLHISGLKYQNKQYRYKKQTFSKTHIYQPHKRLESQGAYLIKNFLWLRIYFSLLHHIYLFSLKEKSWRFVYTKLLYGPFQRVIWLSFRLLWAYI